MLGILSTLIGPDKIGGWVRQGVGALLMLLITNFPGLSEILDLQTRAAIALAVSQIAIGIWSQLVKSDAGKVAMVDALAKDKDSAVKGVIMEPTIAGRELAASLPGKETVVAGGYDASVLAGQPVGRALATGGL